MVEGCKQRVLRVDKAPFGKGERGAILVVFAQGFDHRSARFGPWNADNVELGG